jgi:hypothetical protein
VGACGLMPDGCGGELDCGPCCTPWTCEDWCPPSSSLTNIQECSSTQDPVGEQGSVYVIACPKPDGCSGTLDCWCPIG